MKNQAIIKFLDSTPWAMEQQRLDTLKQVVADHLAGGSLSLGGQAEVSVCTVSNGVAIIPIVGTIKKRVYGMEALSGARTTIDIQDDIQAALNDNSITSIVLDIDSPGGTVDGTKELADLVSSSTKPVVAYANGLMCSAAMWIASAADHIIGYDTANIGSIGVIIQHQDWSKAEEEAGLTTTYIYAGKYKALGNSSEPLSEESKAYIQSKVDKLYTMFVNDIAQNRGLEVQYVLDKLATAETFLAKEAMELQLIDSVGNMADAILKAQELGGTKMEESQGNLFSAEEFEAMKVSLADTTAQLADLTKIAQDAQAAKEKLEAEVAAEKHEALITSMFSGAKVTDDFLAAMIEADESVATAVATVLVAQQSQLDALLAIHEKPTEGASSSHTEPVTPTSVDEAVNHIMQRDNCDIEGATGKVAAEYPQLFNSL